MSEEVRSDPTAPSEAEPEPQAEEFQEEYVDAAEAEEADSEGELTPEEFDELRANEVAYSWQASEYVHHHKGKGWYAALLGIVVVLIGGAVLLHYWLEIVAFLVMGAAVVVYARKPPRTLMYELTPKGIRVDGKESLYEQFRSFSVLADEEWHSIDLIPVKRFSPPLSVLFDTDDFDQIVGHLELHLSREDQPPDVVDRLSRYLRF
ncbi:MAG: hypothetical protein JWN01_1126 [Patescibacteria group bacterium]|nr:hypothetical protein [Patescibacteria group bacterium]